MAGAVNPKAKTPRAASTSASVVMPVERIARGAERAMANRGEVGDISRWNLDGLQSEARGQQVQAGETFEWGGQKRNALRPGMSDQYLVVVPGQFEPANHLELSFILTGSENLVVRLGGVAADEPIRTKCLELDGVGSGIHSDIDQLPGEAHVAIMVKPASAIMNTRSLIC